MGERQFTPPVWMQPFLKLLNNTGGNDPVELLNRRVDSRTNMAVAMLQIAVESQVALLDSLHHDGRLKEVAAVPKTLINRAFRALTEACFEAGEWDRDESDEDYSVVLARSEKAERRLRVLLGLPPSPDDAPPVRPTLPEPPLQLSARIGDFVIHHAPKAATGVYITARGVSYAFRTNRKKFPDTFLPFHPGDPE